MGENKGEGLATLAALGVIGAGLFFAGRKAKREAQEEKERQSHTCNFDEGITKEDFEMIVKRTTKGIKRITDVIVDGPIVYCTVRAQSGISVWDFKVDFNDYGHLTGHYWITSENNDSDIPSVVAKAIKESIVNFDGIIDVSPIEEVDNEEAEEKVPVSFCPYCGTEVVQEGARYCSSCGKLLG